MDISRPIFTLTNSVG